jgi:hypothetical protein
MCGQCVLKIRFGNIGGKVRLKLAVKYGTEVLNRPMDLGRADVVGEADSEQLQIDKSLQNS